MATKFNGFIWALKKHYFNNVKLMLCTKQGKNCLNLLLIFLFCPHKNIYNPKLEGKFLTGTISTVSLWHGENDKNLIYRKMILSKEKLFFVNTVTS